MAAERPGIDGSRDIEDLHHLRLMALLQELVRDHGVRKAAEKLDVDHRTLSAGLGSGRLSRRMRGALEKALLEGGGSPAQEQRQRNEKLAGQLEAVEGQVETLVNEMHQGLGAVQGDVKALRNEQAAGMRRVEERLASVEGEGTVQDTGRGATGSGTAGRTGTKARLRRDYPDLATLEPAGDDEEVFVHAWPLVQEWRELKDSHPDRGTGLDWLLVEERFLTVELALLEEHGLTLPPETYPLKGLDRGGQVNWRRKALVDTRRARRKLELLGRLRRFLTWGFWRRWPGR